MKSPQEKRAVDYMPWKRDQADIAASDARVIKLKESYDITIGQDSFIAETAAVFPNKLVLGDHCFIASGALLRGELRFGNGCTVNANASLSGRITCGNGVHIAGMASLIGFNHGHEDPTRSFWEQPDQSLGIVIENDVWIGANVVIVDGVHIGSNSLIAAGAVVTKNVPPYSLVGGNPARVIRDRRESKPNLTNLAKRLRSFGEMAYQEYPKVLQEAYTKIDGIPYYVDSQRDRQPTVRAWCDAVEIAAFWDELPEHFSRETLIEKLEAEQNPETGCFDRNLPETEIDCWKRIETNGYYFLCVGYALEILGTHLKYPVSMLEKVTANSLYEQERQRDWRELSWGAGSWNDELGTAIYHHLKYHKGAFDCNALFGWLNLHCDPDSGMWGKERKTDGWLQAVNGFYRLTRGTYAQFGQPLPYPEAAINTLLEHTCRYDQFLKDHITACNVLDIIHPLWLCSQQTQHRRKEIENLMFKQLEAMMTRWVPQRGFAFSNAHQPGLQGTEMWLSILYLAADYLGLSKELGYTPKGVHRTPVAYKIESVR